MPFWKKSPGAAHAPQAGSTPGTRFSPRQRGQHGEEVAAQLLQKRGYKIIERNWRAGNALRGEIDCIAWTRGERGERVLAFIEVKTRRDNAQGTPQEAVTSAKQRQIARLASAYVSFNRIENTACRFDVVEVWLEENSPPRCKLHRNAFDYCE
jgi:putative endonuclease